MHSRIYFWSFINFPFNLKIVRVFFFFSASLCHRPMQTSVFFVSTAFYSFPADCHERTSQHENSIRRLCAFVQRESSNWRILFCPVSSATWSSGVAARSIDTISAFLKSKNGTQEMSGKNKINWRRRRWSKKYVQLCDDELKMWVRNDWNTAGSDDRLIDMLRQQ